MQRPAGEPATAVKSTRSHRQAIDLADPSGSFGRRRRVRSVAGAGAPHAGHRLPPGRAPEPVPGRGGIPVGSRAKAGRRASDGREIDAIASLNRWSRRIPRVRSVAGAGFVRSQAPGSFGHRRRVRSVTGAGAPHAGHCLRPGWTPEPVPGRGGVPAGSHAKAGPARQRRPRTDAIASLNRWSRRIPRVRSAAGANDPHAELQGVIMSAQSSALAAQADQFRLSIQVRDLEKQINEMQ
jgi:hypothetical protein